MTVVEGQKVKVKWSSRNKNWYLEKGYSFTKIKYEFIVDVFDLFETSPEKIKCTCDWNNCGVEFLKPYREAISFNFTYCTKCSYKARAEDRKNEHAKNNALIGVDEVYSKILSGELEKFPQGFWRSVGEEDVVKITKKFVNKLIEDKVIDSVDDVPRKLKDNTLNKYRLHGLLKMYTKQQIFELAYPNRFKPWEFQKVNQGYWDDPNNVKQAFDWMIERAISDKKINKLEDVATFGGQQLLKDYNLLSMSYKYKSSFKQLLITFYPDQFNSWNTRASDGFYAIDANKREGMDILVSNLFKDRIIGSIDELASVFSKNIFEKYGLRNLLIKGFSDSPYKALDFYIPNKWKEWELPNVPMGFWENGKNVKNAIEWAVDEMLRKNEIERVSDLERIALNEKFYEYGLSGLLAKTNIDIAFILSIIYDDFNIENYHGQIIGENGDKFDSREEYALDKFLASLKLRKKRNTKKMFFNKEFRESYKPDWIIKNNVIVEYFGYYSENPTSPRFVSYNEKTKRKIKYFNSLDGYIFIELYKQDLKDNFEGVKRKLTEARLIIDKSNIPV